MAGFRAGSASREVLETRERTNRGLRAKAKSGKAIGRARPPFGLRYKPPTDDADGKPIKVTVNAAYEPDPTTVQPLRWMFDQADEGTSLRGIARGLDALGVRPSYSDRTGSTMWNPASVRHILTNRCYVGEGVPFAVRVEKHPDPHFKRRRVARPVDPDGDGAIPIPPGVLPVVIEPALFERVQRRREQNKRESQRKDRTGRPTTGGRLCRPTPVQRQRRRARRSTTPRHRRADRRGRRAAKQAGEAARHRGRRHGGPRRRGNSAAR